MGNQLRQRDEPASLAPGEASLARRAGFTWTLLPASERLTHEVTAGHDVREAVGELRSAARLLDTLG